jgi:hypothetical protein
LRRVISGMGHPCLYALVDWKRGPFDTHKRLDCIRTKTRRQGWRRVFECVSSCSKMVRERYPCAMDGPSTSTEGTSCRHEFNIRPNITGGVFLWFCPHSICYGFHVMKGAESRDEVYSYLVRHFERAPRVVVYDFACALEEYCLNRAPAFFKETLFVVDRFHWWNHTGCAPSFNIDLYPNLKALNTQAAEQANSALQRLKGMLFYMRQDTYMNTLRFVLTFRNHNKSEALKPKMAHAHMLRGLQRH